MALIVLQSNNESVSVNLVQGQILEPAIYVVKTSYTSIEQLFGLVFYVEDRLPRFLENV